jgi:hypothetical protein
VPLNYWFQGSINYGKRVLTLKKRKPREFNIGMSIISKG